MKTIPAMQVFLLLLLLPPLSLSTIIQGIPAPLLARLTQMATLCMSTYLNDLCIAPAGLTKISDISNSTMDVHGWILRDDSLREIVAVFRGTESLRNYVTDTNYTLARFDEVCAGCEVHGGYYLAWVSVVEQVKARLREQKTLYPDYGVVLAGHRYAYTYVSTYLDMGISVLMT